jgi:serine/threonine protein kinase
MSLNRKVAIKALKPRLAKDPNLVARFEREIAALARLDSHAHIVTILAKGRSPGGLPYYIMEYVEGEGGGPPKDLEELISERCLDSETTRELILQVVQALGFAHREGIIHRDIKPANILVDRHGCAKVADFGIACIRAAHQPRHLTMQNTAVGTAIYMSPEQLQDAASVDHRTDVYSTGVMLYQMLTSELPLGDYAPPSNFVPGLNQAWDAIVKKALQPKPENRLADMAEFEEMLTSLEPTSVAGPDPGQATQVGAQESTSVTPSLMTCPHCGAAISEEDQFCANCAASLWIDCRQCGKKVLAGATFCPNCRANVRKFRLFDEHVQLGKECLEKARGGAPPVERLRQLEHTRLAIAKALTYLDDPDAQVLLDEATGLTSELAWEAGEAAVQAKRFGEASYCYEQFLEVSPDHTAANARLEKIRAHRDELVDKAQRSFQQGKLRKATNVLVTATESFGDDQEISALLAEYREKEEHIKEMQARISSLAKESKWCEILQVISDLRQIGVPIKGLDEYAARVQEKLKLVEPLLSSAKLALDQGNHSEALVRANQVLEQVSDHHEALEMAELARGQPAPRRRGRRRRRLVVFLGGLACLVAAGVVGYFYLTEELAIRKAERQIDQEEYSQAARTLRDLTGSYFHDRKATYLLAVAEIKEYASEGKSAGDGALRRSQRNLQELLDSAEKWRTQLKSDLADTVAHVPRSAPDALTRSLEIARVLKDLGAADPSHLAKALLGKAKEADDAKDRRMLGVEDVEFAEQILNWDRSLAEQVVTLVLLDGETRELERGLHVIRGWSRKVPLLADELSSGMLQRAERYVAAHNYEHARRLVGTVKEIAPSRDQEIRGWWEEQAKNCGDRKDWKGAVQVLNYMAVAPRRGLVPQFGRETFRIT